MAAVEMVVVVVKLNHGGAGGGHLPSERERRWLLRCLLPLVRSRRPCLPPLSRLRTIPVRSTAKASERPAPVCRHRVKCTCTHVHTCHYNTYEF